MNRLPEPDPDIQKPQSAANSTNETVGKESTNQGVCQENAIVRPFRSPRDDHQQNTSNGAYKHEQQNRKAMKPQIDTRMAGFRVPWQIWQHSH